MSEVLMKKKRHHLPGRGYGNSKITKIAGRVFRQVRQPNGEIRLVRETHKFNGHTNKPWSRSPRSKKIRRMMKVQKSCQRGYCRQNEIFNWEETDNYSSEDE